MGQYTCKNNKLINLFLVCKNDKLINLCQRRVKLKSISRVNIETLMVRFTAWICKVFQGIIKFLFTISNIKMDDIVVQLSVDQRSSHLNFGSVSIPQSRNWRAALMQVLRPQICCRIRLNLRDACARPRGAKMKKDTLDLQLLSTHNVGTWNAKSKGHKNVRAYAEVVRFAAHRIRTHRPFGAAAADFFLPLGMCFEKHPSCASRVWIVRNVRWYTQSAAVSQRSLPDHITYTRRVGCASATDVRSLPTLRPLHGSIGDKPTKLIASARGWWCDFLRRPLPPPIDALGDLTKATKSMNIASLSRPLHPSYFLMRIQERSVILFGREFGVYCSEGSRISYVLISFRALGYLFGAREGSCRRRENIHPYSA